MSIQLAAAATPGVFSVRDFGAMGDGRTLDTAAINKAVEACSTAGGGQVLLPPGRYLSGTVYLKSGVTFYLDAGAILVGATNLNLYSGFNLTNREPKLHVSNWHRGLLVAENAENITIAGSGMIDGNKVFDPRGEERMRGPHTILFGHCRNFTLRDVSIIDSGNYAVLFFFSDQVDIRRVKFTGGWDGVHFRGSPERGCRDVAITGCEFYTGDDSIAGSYWEHVVIHDCIINSSCNGVRLIGPATQLLIHGCLFYGPGVQPHRSSSRTNMLAAICLQPSGWDSMPGLLDNVQISDITMHNVCAPFHIALKKGNTGGNITINRVSATGVYRAASSVESWSETAFTNVVFRDVTVEYKGGGTLEQARMVVKSPGVDARPLPAWGFYARNVQSLEFDNVRLRSEKEDARPVLICDGVNRLTLDGFNFRHAASAPVSVVLTNAPQVWMRDSSFSTNELSGAVVKEFSAKP